MKRLAMHWGEGFVTRFDGALLTDEQISHLSSRYPVDFFTGIYSPPDHCCPAKYDREVIERLPLSGRLIIDVDAHTPTQKKTAAATVKATAQKLDSLGAPYVLYHSGRGYHFEISSALSIIDLPVAHTMAAQTLVDDADLSIYNVSGTIRCPNTINSKTGTYKVPISIDYLKLSKSQFAEKLTRPTEMPCIEPNPIFDKFILDVFRNEIDDLKAKVKPYQGKSGTLTRIPNKGRLSPSSRYILETGEIELGTRHHVTFFLCLELKHTGLPKEQCLEILTSWGEKVIERGCSKSSEYEILVDAKSVVNFLYSRQTYLRLDYKRELRRLYVKQFHNRKNALRWKDNINECKVFCAFKAASLINSKFYLSHSVIKEITRLNKLSNGHINYIKSLIEKRYIDTVNPTEVPLFTPREDGLPDTLCYEVLV